MVFFLLFIYDAWSTFCVQFAVGQCFHIFGDTYDLWVVSNSLIRNSDDSSTFGRYCPGNAAYDSDSQSYSVSVAVSWWWWCCCCCVCGSDLSGVGLFSLFSNRCPLIMHRYEVTIAVFWNNSIIVRNNNTTTGTCVEGVGLMYVTVTNFFLSSNGGRQLRVHCSGHMDDLSMYVDVQSFFCWPVPWTNRSFFKIPFIQQVLFLW